MPQESETLRNLTTRVRQLILLYREERQRGEAMKAQLEKQNEHLAELQQRLQRLEKDYKNLKTARILEVSDGDIAATKSRISKLIGNVNRCLTLLGD